MSAGPIAVLAAMDEELAGVRGGAWTGRSLRVDRCRVAVGRFEGVPVILASTGDGPENAGRGARALFERFPVSGAIVVGVSGGLSPALAPGRVLAGRDVLEEGRQPVPPPDADWLRRAVQDAGATPATLVSSRTLLCTARSKQEAYAALPAGIVASVDLETAAFARAAADRGLPWLALRAIADPAEESLPLDFNTLRDASGAVDRRRVAWRALRRPGLVAPLWRLHRRVGLCAESLRRAVSALLAPGGAR
jgi:adenosylhomocysteine nucleosidase